MVFTIPNGARRSSLLTEVLSPHWVGVADYGLSQGSPERRPVPGSGTYVGWCCCFIYTRVTIVVGENIKSCLAHTFGCYEVASLHLPFIFWNILWSLNLINFELQPEPCVIRNESIRKGDVPYVTTLGGYASSNIPCSWLRVGGC